MTLRNWPVAARLGISETVSDRGEKGQTFEGSVRQTQYRPPNPKMLFKDFRSHLKDLEIDRNRE